MIDIDNSDRVVPEFRLVPTHADTDVPSLAAIAYAAFFTEAEREEIGTFDDLPDPERARWESVAAHVARTVVPPVDQDIEQWRAEQRKELARQVKDAPYTRDVWRATMRATDLQHGLETLRTLLVQSRESAARARSYSQRLATTTRAMQVVVGTDTTRSINLIDRSQRPHDIDPTIRTPPDLSANTDRPADPHELMVRSA
ncbi:MAG: hypothetical protein AVDCRST_MAG33-32 [uncultured Thermomicrobiales bacterium]|uniref:Uncharacterized protein n=1 Tax=uncultured Thermomicrobiales bacterium TaxID=1645740 RepID=A0A6J4U5G4_9BACT|nr:MAG: hypothetical protein AVDCRST_MAG33-32 [uncultured Thermomicrobiales bacterium]